MLWSLAVLAPFCVLMSDLPRVVAWPLALAVAAFGIVDARRAGCAPRLALVIPVGRGQATCDGQPMIGLVVVWRGPLAFLCWQGREGAVRRVVFWPDTLPPAPRRELRLAVMRMQSARGPASMAR